MSNNIDCIFYINVDGRTDKQELMESQLNELGLSFERFPAIYAPVNGLGCTKSHLEVHKLAKARGYKNALVLEDDFIFNVTREEFEDRLEQLFQEDTPEFDICFLSNTCIDADEEIPGCDFLRRALNVYGAEAYIITEKYYDTFIARYEHAVQQLEATGMHWMYISDRAWLPLLQNDRWYRFVEKFGKQDRDIPHDNR
jgi:GR25 family glycosyltransferase involved in LPS biosynthesis